MKIVETPIENLFILESKVFEDSRGYFFEAFNKSQLEKKNISYNFVQDNQSKSKYGVIRALHYQLAPHSQAKLVRVIKGKVLDVVVDLRTNSKTFGKTFSIELSDTNFKQLLIPRGFAHGFSVLSKIAVFFYKCDNFYNKQSEAGIIYNDSKLNIDWKIPENDIIISEKDLENQSFDNAQMNF